MSSVRYLYSYSEDVEFLIIYTLTTPEPRGPSTCELSQYLGPEISLECGYIEVHQEMFAAISVLPCGRTRHIE